MDFILPIVSGVILITGVMDDLITRKIHNHLILAFIPIALISVYFIKGPFDLIYMSLLSGIIALVIAIPLYFLKVIGGGDAKLYAVVSLTWEPSVCIWAFIYALPISLVFGFLRILFKKETKVFLKNIITLIKFKKLQSEAVQTFPFSIALFLGWLSVLVLSR